MATYLILNLLFIAIVLTILLFKQSLYLSKTSLITLIVLLVSTAVFDSLIINAGIVGYDSAKNLGIRIGSAPIEDFFYAIMATILIPSTWHYLGKRRDYEKNS